MRYFGIVLTRPWNYEPRPTFGHSPVLKTSVGLMIECDSPSDSNSCTFSGKSLNELTRKPSRAFYISYSCFALEFVWSCMWERKVGWSTTLLDNSRMNNDKMMNFARAIWRLTLFEFSAGCTSVFCKTLLMLFRAVLKRYPMYLSISGRLAS